MAEPKRVPGESIDAFVFRTLNELAATVRTNTLDEVIAALEVKADKWDTYGADDNLETAIAVVRAMKEAKGE